MLTQQEQQQKIAELSYYIKTNDPNFQKEYNGALIGWGDEVFQFNNGQFNYWGDRQKAWKELGSNDTISDFDTSQGGLRPIKWKNGWQNSEAMRFINPETEGYQKALGTNFGLGTQPKQEEYTGEVSNINGKKVYKLTDKSWTSKKPLSPIQEKEVPLTNNDLQAAGTTEQQITAEWKGGDGIPARTFTGTSQADVDAQARAAGINPVNLFYNGSTTPGSNTQTNTNSLANIPFKSGFVGDKKSIETLVNRTNKVWSATDKQNWDYATGGAALPSGVTVKSDTTENTDTNPTAGTGELKTIVAPDGTTYSEIFSSNTKEIKSLTDKGWILYPKGSKPKDATKKVGYNNAKDIKFATLQDSSGQYKAVVAVDSAEATQLLSNGWGMAPAGGGTGTTVTLPYITSHPDIFPIAKPGDETIPPGDKTVETPGDVVNTPNDIIWKGDHALIKFDTDPDGSGPGNTSTVYYVDVKNKTMRPFLSEQAFNNAYGGQFTLQEAESQGLIKTLSGSMLGPGMPLDIKNGSWTLHSNEGGVREDGTWKDMSLQIGDAALKNRYGQPANEGLFEAGYSAIKGFLDLAKQDPSIGLSAQTINEIENSPDKLAFYMSAVGYGGYSITDIYKEIKRNELIKGGNTQLEAVKVIDPYANKTEYEKTSEGAAVKNNSFLEVPAQLFGVDSSFLDLSIFKLPDEIFQKLVQPIDWTTQASQDEAEKIMSAYHDVLLKQVDATNDRDKAIADYEYNQFKTELDKKYGIQLSDDANTAWDQLNELTSGNTNKGILDSGIHNELVDKYLQDVRKVDERMRTENKSQEEQSRRQYYLNYASPEQIQNDLTEQEKIDYGLKPDPEISQYFTYQNLKSMYPDLLDREINNYLNSIIDENGNYRSQLQQNYWSNVYQIGEEKFTLQQNKLLQDKLNEEEKAYAEFSQSEPFKKYNAPSQEDTTTSSTSGIGNLYKNLEMPSGVEVDYKEPEQNLDDAWTKFKAKNPTANNSWAGFEQIVGSPNGYTNIQDPYKALGITAPTGASLWGKKTIY
jgi:hypothetical protein